jgi:hypothetical protein
MLLPVQLAVDALASPGEARIRPDALTITAAAIAAARRTLFSSLEIGCN